MKALTTGRVHIDGAGESMAHPAADRLVDALMSEGLVVRDGDWLRLPE